VADLKLAFGCVKAIPDGIDTAWGARLIWPDDLLHDRQDLKGPDAELLKAWLNGVPSGQGALRQALATARELANGIGTLRSDEDRTVTLYEDEDGVIVGNPQASHGYLYVAAWMKPDNQRRENE
jgi:hypothetical protein